MPHIRPALGALAVAAVLGLTGCTGPGTPTDGSTPIGGGRGVAAGAGTPSARPTPAAKRPPRPAARPKPARPVADCVVSTWRLKTITSTDGGAVPNVRFSGRGAFDLKFDDAGRWRLVGRPETRLTATIDVGGIGVSGTATIDGSASGRYRLVDSVAVFRLQRTSGKVKLRYPTGGRTVGMDALAGSLVPDGTAALRCSADALLIQAQNVTLGLTRR